MNIILSARGWSQYIQFQMLQLIPQYFLTSPLVPRYFNFIEITITVAFPFPRIAIRESRALSQGRITYWNNNQVTNVSWFFKQRKTIVNSRTFDKYNFCNDYHTYTRNNTFIPSRTGILPSRLFIFKKLYSRILPRLFHRFKNREKQ